MPDIARQERPFAAVVHHPLKTDVGALRSAVAQAASEASWAATEWYETDEHDAGLAATRAALAAGASLIIGSGGDGTIRAIAEVLRGTGVPLAIVPQGTGNLLARNLGMPLGNVEEAVRAAFAGQDHAVDLGIITITRPPETDAVHEDDQENAHRDEKEHVFLVLAGMGLDARTISVTSSKLKKRVGWLAYVDAGMRTIIKERPLSISYAVDGAAPRSMMVYTVMIGNCGLLPGGVLLIPEAKLDDGLLDVVALRPLGPLSWLRIGRKIGWENGVLRRSKVGRMMIDLVNDTKSVSYLRARRYEISVSEPEPIQLDGDDFGMAIAASGGVDPGALVVRMLPEWTPAV